ncbi:MAG: prepilin-type N-terminal cleavage/methylation domain-containing protein [Acidimicrobiales bacterium]
MRPPTFRDERGFTVIELLIALMILAIVLTALAPAFFETMSATAMTNQRSVANGLAVAADEQLRALPYWEVGYNIGTTPAGCPTTDPVTFSPALTNPPVSALLTTQTVGGTQYTLQRCLNWMTADIQSSDDSPSDATTPDADDLAGAYKQSVVTVTWTGSGLPVSETSAIYPGGKGPYTTAYKEYTPANATPPASAFPPSPPTTVTAVDDVLSPSSTIDVAWVAPLTTPTPVAEYIVEYNTTGVFTSDPSTYTSSPPVTGLLWNTGIFTEGSTYYFQVISVAADGTTSTPSTPIVSATTASAVTTGCQPTALVVNPSSGVIDSNGVLLNAADFSLTVSAPPNCDNVTVAYTTSGATMVQTPVTGNGGLMTGAAGSSSTAWSVGNHPFTVYVNGSAYGPLIQVQVDVCQEHGSSGQC